VFALSLWPALRGQPLIHPDGWTLAALAALAVLAVAAEFPPRHAERTADPTGYLAASATHP
jgi:hypothetical protein